MLSKAQIPETLNKQGRISLRDLDPSLVDDKKNRFKSLPDGAEGVFLMTARHPLGESLWRVDEVTDGMRPVFRAECEALGYEVVSEQPIGVVEEVPVEFPYSAILRYPDHVNTLLRLAREIEAEAPIAASKPGRVETNLHALTSDIKKIDKELVVEFFDRLIDFYIDAGNFNYANRQAKAAIAAMGKNRDPEWLARRVRQLLDRGFYSTLLVDEALEHVEKEFGEEEAFDLHLDVVDRILANKIKPNKGTFKSVAAHAKDFDDGRAKLNELLLSHIGRGFYFGSKENTEVKAFRKAALAALDELPTEDRLRRLNRLAQHANGEEGSIEWRHDVWHALTARVEEFPQLEEQIVRLAFTICKNIRIGYSDERYDIDEGFRARVGQYLQQVSPATLEANYDHWATVLDDYEDWARGWFFDTFITLEELVDKHPNVFKHDGIIRACTRGLLLGAVDSENTQDFTEKLHDFLDLTECKALRPEDFVRLTFDLIRVGRPEEVKPTLNKVAGHAPADLQAVFVGIAEAADQRGLDGQAAVEILTSCAAWMTEQTRSRLREVFSQTDPWDVFIEAALNSGATIAEQGTWLDVSGGGKMDWRSEMFDLLEHKGQKYALIGRGDYEAKLWLKIDDNTAFNFDFEKREEELSVDEHFQTARLYVTDDDEVVVLSVHGEGRGSYHSATPFCIRVLGTDGETRNEITLGEYDRVFFARHQPWAVALTEETITVFDLKGTPLSTLEFQVRHVGDWDDFWESYPPHPMRTALGIVGTQAALIFGDDPTNPQVVERRVEGFIETPDGIVMETKVGRSSQLITARGEVVQELPLYVTGSFCGQCNEIHTDTWISTNLRGLEGEIAGQDKKAAWKIQTPSGATRGFIDSRRTSDDYWPDLSFFDLDHNGFDEAYLLDYSGNKVLTIWDPAAGLRAQLNANADAIRSAQRDTVRINPSATQSSVDTYIASTVQAADATLGDSLFEPARQVVREVVQRYSKLFAELETAEEKYPAKSVYNKVRLPRSELMRLQETYFGYDLNDYPLPRAVEAGSLDSYQEHWRRKTRGIEPTQEPDMSYLRTLIHAHMNMARETGLKPIVRQRILDLVEQLVARTEADSTWLYLCTDTRDESMA